MISSWDLFGFPGVLYVPAIWDVHDSAANLKKPFGCEWKQYGISSFTMSIQHRESWQAQSFATRLPPVCLNSKELLPSASGISSLQNDLKKPAELKSLGCTGFPLNN